MVCKEEVCKWFKSLSGSTRIEVMCGFLNVLCPIELRYFGSCIESLASRDYHMLSRSECNANDLPYVSSLTDIKDKLCRSKIIVALALLHSSNYCCSRPLYRTLSGAKLDDLTSLIVDEDVCKEILLMYTMAVYHPAFSFNEKVSLSKYLHDLMKLIRPNGSSQNQKIEQYDSCHSHCSSLPSSSSLSAVNSVSSSISVLSTKVHNSLVTSSATVTTVNSTYGTPKCQHQAFPRMRMNVASPVIALLELLEVCGKTFRIKVTLSTGKQVEVLKTQQDILSFHTRLLQLFPPEAKVVCPTRYIPHLPGFTSPDKKWEEPVEDFISKMREYFRQLTAHLPLHLLNSDYVSNFFHPPTKMFPENEIIENTALHSFTVYNSNIIDLPDSASLRNEAIQHSTPAEIAFIPTNMEDRSRHNVSRDSSKVMSSSSSSLSSSPFASPPASGTNSRSASPGNKSTLVKTLKQNCKNIPMDQFARKVGLEPYKEILQQYTIEELQCKGIEELTRLGMTYKAANKLRKLFNNSRPNFTSNGLTKHVSSTSTNKKKMPMYQNVHTSGKDSLVRTFGSSCSDFSSPSASPPTSCNGHSVTSSSDESLHEAGKFTENKNAEKPPTNPAQKEIKTKIPFRRYENKCQTDKGKRCSNTTQKPFLQSEIPVNDNGEELSDIVCKEPTDVTKRSNQQPKRPNVLNIQCHSTVNQKENTNVLHKMSASISSNDEKSNDSLNSISLNHNPKTNVENKMQHNSCPAVSLAPSVVSDINDCKMNPKENLSTNLAETEAIIRLHQQVPEGSNTQYPSFVASSIHTNHPQHKGSALTCVNNMTVNSACPSHSISSPLMTTTNATQSTTLQYGCVNYLSHIYPPPLPFVPTQTASQPNAFISPTMQTPSPASSFVFPLTNVLPELAYANFHIPPPNHNTPHTSATSPAGLVTFPANCTYYPGSHFNGLPPTGIHLNPVTCFNCGTIGHSGYDCEDVKEDHIKTDQFHLNYVPASQAVEIRN